MRMNRIFFSALGLLIMLALLAGNYWIFQTAFSVYYLEWYLKNGALFGIATTACSLVWGNMREHAGLISANPWNYLGSYLQLIGLPIYTFGTHLKSDDQKTVQRPLFDSLMTVILFTSICAVLLLWLIVVVPLQYFVYLIVGAPGRLMRNSQRQAIAMFRHSRLEVKEIGREEPLPQGWWHASLVDKPVAITGLFSSLFFLVVKSLL